MHINNKKSKLSEGVKEGIRSRKIGLFIFYRTTCTYGFATCLIYQQI